MRPLLLFRHNATNYGRKKVAAADWFLGLGKNIFIGLATSSLDYVDCALGYVDYALRYIACAC